MPSAVDSFDPASPTMAADRYAVLAALRSEYPVVFGPAVQMWAVTGHGPSARSCRILDSSARAAPTSRRTCPRRLSRSTQETGGCGVTPWSAPMTSSTAACARP